MNIERDEKIHFHELGTLISVTRWITTHDEGVAEWLKNSRRAYQPDRANVAEEHRTAALLEQAVKQIIEHPVFRDWLKDPTRPKYFREAGHFWGIAPGTPPKTVLERVSSVERTLSSALKALNERGVNELIEQRGKVLFERKDIERCLEFQRVLTERFKRDLTLLAPGFGI